MNQPIDEASSSPNTQPPSNPLLVYDGDCSFCRLWVEKCKCITSDRVRFAPFQEVASQFPQVPLENFHRSVQLFLPDGRVLSAAEAVLCTWACTPSRANWRRLLPGIYRRVPGVAPVAERCYRFLATHRSFFYRITCFLWGKHFVCPSYALTRWCFLRALGLVYLIAFLSLRVQLTALIGAQGILPASRLLGSISQSLGPGAYRFYPTLAWVDSSDRFLALLTNVGAVASLLVVLGIATAPCLIVAWVLYLSLVNVGGDFMSFQWDILLLETGFLAILFAPWRLLSGHWTSMLMSKRKGVLSQPVEPGRPRGTARTGAGHPPHPLSHNMATPPWLILWLLRWLLFRLLFMSGAVKLLSKDPTWRNLSALDYHYYTQPLPTPAGWYMAQLPHRFQEASVIFMFFIELCVPFLIFAPRRLRFAGAALMVLLQVLIGVTGNYTFFNLLTIVLCLLLLDDAFLRRFIPVGLEHALGAGVKGLSKTVTAPEMQTPVTETVVTPATSNVTRARPGPRFAAGRITRGIVAAVIFISSAAYEAARISRGTLRLQTALDMSALLEPLHIVNGYGLFQVMTTSRLEIIVQGSNDGEHWLDYEFKYKPGDVKRPPPWVEPHQPRLDWQMWFAALGTYDNNPWFINFMVRLLEGSSQVRALLDRNPFPKRPPRFVRAMVYEYHFTDLATRKATGDWWRRELKGQYFPVASLKSGETP